MAGKHIVSGSVIIDDDPLATEDQRLPANLGANGALVVEGVPGGTAFQTSGIADPTTLVTATIPNGETISGTVDLRTIGVAVGLIMPAAWTAAAITMRVSHDGVTFVDMYDTIGEWRTAAAADRGISLEPLQFVAWRYLQVRSGTAGTPVAQGAERVIGIVARRV